MTVRDELLRAAVYAGAEPAELLRIHRLAPLVEYASQLSEAIDSEAVVAAAFAEREAEIARQVNAITDELVEELVGLRREVVLLTARVAALEPAPFDPAEPDLAGDEEPDLATVGAAT